MNKFENILEFNKIITLLKDYCATEYARNKADNLSPILSELELSAAQNETTNAARLLILLGNIIFPSVDIAQSVLSAIDKEGIVYPEQLEHFVRFLASCKRIKRYLEKGKSEHNSIAYYSDELEPLDDVINEINRCITANDIDSNATKELADIRRKIENTKSQINVKLNEFIKTKKKYFSDSFVSIRNGHYTLPVKKEYKNMVSGSVIATSQTGTTYFIEPSVAIKLSQKLETLYTEEQIEKDRIIYTICAMIYEQRDCIEKNIKIIEALDFAFAKGKLSVENNCTAPKINTDRYIKIKKGRHPLLNPDICVPLDFEIGNGINGIVITGPNTGGKTVSLKLVGLFSVMAQCGLHLPCESADICMNSNILCDIGDGQNISENLSTFSAHIQNIIGILENTTRESLVLLDELGSGTDPAEGMGIAIAILEELRNSNCLFVATTHYSEVKTFADKSERVINARMTFNKDTLKPEYKLIIGEAGESCALYIAEKLGFPKHLLEFAKIQINAKSQDEFSYAASECKKENKSSSVSKIQKKPKSRELSKKAKSFNIGDSVIVHPEKKLGIVYKTSDEKGMIGVQIQGKKQKVNYKRIELKTKASELYPEDYDFSIIFDTVDNRKARHQMSKRHCPGVVINVDED